MLIMFKILTFLIKQINKIVFEYPPPPHEIFKMPSIKEKKRPVLIIPSQVCARISKE